MMCVDWWQLQPVTGTCLCSNPYDVDAGRALKGMELLWGYGVDTIRNFWELKDLMRCKDEWYNDFLQQARNGNMTTDMYCFFHGLPTFCPGNAGCQCNGDLVPDKDFTPYKKSWANAFMRGCQDMKALIANSECSSCAKVRQDRHRVLTDLKNISPDLHAPPFPDAPAVYSFNVPRYYSIQLRAREYAKQNNKQLSWCYAKDVPLHPGDRDLSKEALEKKLAGWLLRHDQHTSNLSSLLALAVGLPVRLTDTVDRDRQLYRGRRGFIHGWTLHPECIPVEVDGEWLLDVLPECIYVHFPEAQWRIGKLPIGVYPFTKKSRTWKVNKYTGIEARRTGYLLLPDFGSTAHMVQGQTLDAEFCDCQEAGGKVSTASQIAAYVCLSRVKELLMICVLQAFSFLLFTRGPPKGPDLLIRKLRGEFTCHAQLIEEWDRPDKENEDANADTAADPMKKKFVCTSCYLEKKTSVQASCSKLRRSTKLGFLPEAGITRCLDTVPEMPRKIWSLDAVALC